MSGLILAQPSIRQKIASTIDASFDKEVSKNMDAITFGLVEQAFRSSTRLILRHSSRMEPPGFVRRSIATVAAPIIYYSENLTWPISLLFKHSIVGILAVKAAKRAYRYGREHPPVAAHVHIILSNHSAEKIARKAGFRNTARGLVQGASPADHLGLQIADKYELKLEALNRQLAPQNLRAQIDVLSIAPQAGIEGEGMEWGWVVNRGPLESRHVTLTISDTKEYGPAPTDWPRARRGFFNWDVAVGVFALQHAKALNL